MVHPASQDLSVAGLRKGLQGERSGLFMEQIRIVKEMRENVYRIDGTDELLRLPRFLVWENVAPTLRSMMGDNQTAVVYAVDPYNCSISDTQATLGSLFDGISGFPKIWEDIHGKGTARWSSEVEEFCIAVAKYHFGED